MERVGFIGVGKLGLSLALILEEAGYNVVCFDKSENQRTNIKNKTLKTVEPHIETMLQKSSNLTVVDSIKEVYALPSIFMVVLTPSLSNGSYDHTAVDDVVKSLLAENEATPDYTDKLLVITCTVMPQYTATIQERLSKYNYHVCYSPEFIAQGDIVKGMKCPDLVLIGHSSEFAKKKLSEFYTNYVVNTPEFAYMTPLEAEITKISINCFLTTKISFANTIGDLVVKVGGNPQVVLNAVGSDSRVGKKFLRWGHGFGGPCLPRDNRALCYFSKTIACRNKIGEVTDEINVDHLKNLLDYIVSINTEKKPLFFNGVVYKKNTTILEESQQLELAKEAVKLGMKVFIHDSESVLKSLESLYGDRFSYLYELDTAESNKYLDLNEYIQ
jgi:nucleotide sugar dehydrogenase